MRSGAFLKGISLARGVAQGCACVPPRGSHPGTAPQQIEETRVAHEIERVAVALPKAEAQLSELQASASSGTHHELNDLLGILRDPLFFDRAKQTIQTLLIDAPSAVRATKDALFLQFSSLGDACFRERAAELSHAAPRVLSILREGSGDSIMSICGEIAAEPRYTPMLLLPRRAGGQQDGVR